MGAPFNASSLERGYAFLDKCPDSLFEQVVTIADGTLQERVAGVVSWRDSLLAGRLPAEGGWPPAEIARPARRALDILNLARFCRNQVELVDAVLRDVLRGFARGARAFSEEVGTKLRELEQLERVRAEKEEAERALRERREVRQVTLDQETLQRLRTSAAHDVAGRERTADTAILDEWGERARVWAEVSDVFGDLGELMGRGWDLSQGVLKHVGWTALLKLRELLERLPQLRELVRQLGRLQHATDGESVAERIMVPVRRLEAELREVRTPLAASETRGIERSGEIARMLPSEALLLGHPKLRLLWHARRAERTLLTYRVEGVMTERVLVERESQEEIEGKRPRPERGPIVVIVDTSGSMHGLPEQVAKALVLEAVRTAHAERRRCYLYAYSGPGQVIEHDLDLSPEGVGRLLSFLGFTFGGGNDETGVVTKVLARLREREWKRADILFVSDGEWPVPASLVAAVHGAREVGTRFHGVQIGNLGQTGLHRLCDPVHVFRDWAAAGGWR